jgi:hypothetical protein
MTCGGDESDNVYRIVQNGAVQQRVPSHLVPTREPGAADRRSNGSTDLAQHFAAAQTYHGMQAVWAVRP